MGRRVPEHRLRLLRLHLLRLLPGRRLLPRTVSAQYAVGVGVSRSQLAPGDLVFFNGLGHVGIYIGGNQFIHSPHTGDVVKISSITGYYSSGLSARAAFSRSVC